MLKGENLLLSILDDNSVLDGSYYPTNFSVATQTADVQEFVSGYTALFGSPPDGIAASGYDAMRLLARAIEIAGSLDPVAVRDAFAASVIIKARQPFRITMRTDTPSKASQSK